MQKRNEYDPRSPETASMTGPEIVSLSRKHTLYEWSAQSKVDPIPVASGQGNFISTRPRASALSTSNSQLIPSTSDTATRGVIQAISDQAATLAYANPFMATEPRARPWRPSSPKSVPAISILSSSPTAEPKPNENAIKLARFFTGRHKIIGA